MLRLLLVLLLLPLSTLLQGQVILGLLFGDKLNSEHARFGLNAGFGLTTLDGVEGGEPLNKFEMGLFFELDLGEKWVLNPETMPLFAMGQRQLAPYATGDASLDAVLADATVTRRIDCIPTLVLLNYRITRVFSVGAGAYGTLLMDAEDVFRVEAATETTEHTISLKDQLHTIEAGVAGGAQYELKKGEGMSIGARYMMGLTPIFKDSDPDILGRVLLFYAKIPIGRAKALKAAEAAP